LRRFAALTRFARRPEGIARKVTVDRDRATRNINSALIAASIALGAFGLTFLAAILYIG
jgi:hypothetical protein